MNLSSILILAGIISAFAYFFTDEFLAVSQYLDDTRCELGWDAYCTD
jgi:hypothetical protein